MTGYRRFGSRLEGHPTPVLPWVDVATGSLGQGLPDGVGVALAGRYLDRLPVPGVGAVRGQRDGGGLHLGGPGQGRVLPAVQPDRDRGRQPAGPARPHRAPVGPRRLHPARRGVRGAGADHRRSRPRRDRPGVPLHRGRRLGASRPWSWPAPSRAAGSPRSRTTKAGTASPSRPTWPRGPSRNWAASATCWSAARGLRTPAPGPALAMPAEATSATAPAAPPAAPEYSLGREGRHPQGVRRRAGRARRRAGPRSWRSTARSATPPTPTSSPGPTPGASSRCSSPSSRWSAAAVGLSARHYIPFASTFAAFFTRAYDFIRMAAISQASIRLSGSHAGVEIGADGPSQMALEDLAMMRAVHGSTVLYPSDATSTAALVRRWRTARASATCGPPAAPTRCCTPARRPSPSAARRCCGRARTTR